MVGRYYEVTLDGSTVPMRVVVPLRDDHHGERHDAVMFARESDPEFGKRVLRGVQRGAIVHVKGGR